MRGLLCLLAFSTASADRLEVPIAKDGSYRVLIDGTEWFQSGATTFRHSGQDYSTLDGSLRLLARTGGLSSDKLGAFDGAELLWGAVQGTKFKTSIKVYENHAIFTQTFPNGANGTSVGDRDKIISVFPSFVPAWKETKGFLSFHGSHQGASDNSMGLWHSPGLHANKPPNINSACRVVTADFSVTPSTGAYDAYVMQKSGVYEKHAKSYCDSGHVWAYHADVDEAACAAKCNELSCKCYDVKPTAPTKSDIGTGIAGSGPVVVFSQDLKTSIVLSAFSNFMAHSQTFDGSTLGYGIMGGVTSVPEGYSISTILSVGTGINSAMDSWGDVLLKEYKKDRYAYKRDLAMQYLGYSTDNGAFYYYTTEPGKNYEDTLVDVQSYAEKAGLPYKYILLDSWWYLKGHASGVKDWAPRADIFPDGMAGFYNKTKRWPQQLHNRVWATDNVYAKQNGGKYEQICDKVCVPHDPNFWTDLFANKTSTGMFMYEQDWLHNEFDGSIAMGTESATLGRTWLMQMNEGAVNTNVTIQMCMAYVRHLLQSVEMSEVTNARASRDYHPGNDNWDTATSAIINHAIGIAPSKDNYWSVEKQSGSKWGPTTAEPHSRLEAAAISLTNGPVAPSDKIGLSNVSLIMQSCDSSGRLLTPDRPATEIDEHFVQAVFGSGGPQGHLWATSVMLSGEKFSYVMGVDLQSDYKLSPSSLSYPANSQLLALESTSSATIPVSEASALLVPQCSLDDFKLYTLAPVIEGYALLGEPDKWVAVSSQRFSDMKLSASGGSVSVHGPPGEVVQVRWSTPKGLLTSHCKIPGAGSTRASVTSGTAACGDATGAADALLV